MEDFELIVSDWNSFQKAKKDEKKFNEKLQEKIKENLSDLIGEESVIMGTGKSVSVPMKDLKFSRIRYESHKEGFGTGFEKNGGKGVKEGEVLGKLGKKGLAKGNEPGTEPGEDWYETKVEMEEIEEAFFEELELPILEKKDADSIATVDTEFDRIQPVGVWGNLDKKRTLKQSFKKSDQTGIITKEDLRFRSWDEKEKPKSQAVIVAMMDTSGSMGMWEKYMSRSFFFWLKRFLEKKYEKVEIVYLAHHTMADEVDEESFFTKGESGGTICSSVYRKALEVIDERYKQDYNIFAFHVSDGDNLTSDCIRCIHLIKTLREKCVKVGYVEVNQYNRHSALMNAYRKVSGDILEKTIIGQKKDLQKALLTFFGKGKNNEKMG